MMSLNKQKKVQEQIQEQVSEKMLIWIQFFDIPKADICSTEIVYRAILFNRPVGEVTFWFNEFDDDLYKKINDACDRYSENVAVFNSVPHQTTLEEYAKFISNGKRYVRYLNYWYRENTLLLSIFANKHNIPMLPFLCRKYFMEEDKTKRFVFKDYTKAMSKNSININFFGSSVTILLDLVKESKSVTNMMINEPYSSSVNLRSLDISKDTMDNVYKYLTSGSENLMSTIDNNDVLKLVIAAAGLNIESLLNLCCVHIQNIVKDNSDLSKSFDLSYDEDMCLDDIFPESALNPVNYDSIIILDNGDDKSTDDDKYSDDPEYNVDLYSRDY
jgi:hypothetical protein